jgi:predicted RNase H-like HicB family nuclease
MPTPTLENGNFDEFVLSLYVDEAGDWFAHFHDIPTISAFGDTLQEALEELKTAWELVKEEYRSQKITIGSYISPVLKEPL